MIADPKKKKKTLGNSSQFSTENYILHFSEILQEFKESFEPSMVNLSNIRFFESNFQIFGEQKN